MKPRHDLSPHGRFTREVVGRLNGPQPAFFGVIGDEIKTMEPARTCRQVGKNSGKGKLCCSGHQIGKF